MNVNDRYDRYQRQMLLRELGPGGQDKLLSAKVLVVGAGGLGCPALQYLAAAGIGTLGIVDDDTVSISNLHRQVLYGSDDVGLPKADLAAASLSRLNPGIDIIPFRFRLTVENAFDLFRRFDIILDGTDNFATRYLVNDACVLLQKPLIYGAISQFEGQVSVFANKNQNDANYRDLFPDPPNEDEVLNCAEAGVLGVLPGIIGTMQANEAIKLITGMGISLANRLLTFNALDNSFYELQVSAGQNSKALIPADEIAFRQMNYQWLCSTQPCTFEIDEDEFDVLREQTDAIVVDVRELHESPAVEEFEHRRIPMAQLPSAAAELNTETIILFCQSGKRSKQAVEILTGLLGRSKKIYSLKGGIVNWKNQHMAQ
jgi:adenylyltransferase/sulfurtransferase